MRYLVIFMGLIYTLSIEALAQQVIDSTFTVQISDPVYSLNQGPVIYVDEYHNNDMSLNQRMFPLIKLLRADGYRFRSFNTPISASTLKDVEFLVIIGALHESNIDNWVLPTPEALDPNEINALLHWINGGGNLLLVADHMPFPGAVNGLASRLGVEWHNGFVIDSINWGMSIFSKREKTLNYHYLLDGRNPSEVVNWVATYYGSGFQLKDSTITGLFSFVDPNEVSYQTQKAWHMSEQTPVIPATKLYQAAVLEKGKGKVAIIGEASLFSAQLVGKDKKPVGINFPNEGQNLQFVLNLFHWLSGVLD